MPDWEAHYKSREVAEQTPADVLVMNQHLLSAQGQALDYASGLAANGIWLANRGYRVSAWDGSQVAVDKVNQYARQQDLNLTAEVRDLESEWTATAGFDLLVVSFFLHRESLAGLSQLLRPGGLLFYQTFCGENINGRGPSNPDFRLKQGELLRVFSDLQLVFYREDNGMGDLSSGIRDQVLFVAAKK